MDDYYGTIPIKWQGPYARLIPRRRRSKIDLLIAIVYLFKGDDSSMTLIGDLDAAVDALDAIADVVWHERNRRVTIPLNEDNQLWITTRILPRIGLARRVQHIMIATDGTVQFAAEDYFNFRLGFVQTGPAITEAMLDSLVRREMIDGYDWVEDARMTASSESDNPLSIDDTEHGVAVSESQVIPMLLESCPGFHSLWRAHLDEWPDHTPSRGHSHYADVNAFAHYLKAQLSAGITDEFSAAFAAIERMMTDGDDDVRQLLTIGLFEDLSDSSEMVAQFLCWAGPYTRAGWYWVNGVRYVHSFFYELIAREIELRRQSSK